MHPYSIAPLRTDQIDPAFALVVHIVPTLALSEWRVRCRRTMGHESNLERETIFVATNPAGYIQGLCIVAARQHTFDRRTLDIPIFVVASASDEAGVAISLLEHLKGVARIEACRQVRIWASGGDSWSRALKDTEYKRWDGGVLLESDSPV